MHDEILWDCVNELAPFGSDEGADAYVEYRRWRVENPKSNLADCIAWILGGRHAEYGMKLTQDAAIDDCDESAVSLGFSDAFTLDATIIATVLGQLVDEGRIDSEAKVFAQVAVSRQIHPRVLAKLLDETSISERQAILQVVQRVIDTA